MSRARYYTTTQLVSSWAAVDPKAAQEWIEQKRETVGWEDREAFVEGFYENDRAARCRTRWLMLMIQRLSIAISAILRNLYCDSKDEATKFIDGLPENRRPEAFEEAFRRLILLEERGYRRRRHDAAGHCVVDD